MDDIYNIVSKFRNHPSIIKIKEKVHTKIKFSFTVNTLDNIERKIKEMNASKPTHINTIPSKILRDNSDIISKYIFNFYKECIKCCEFPHTMKMAEIIPSFKKGHRTKKENYRPVSILPSVSKIFEKSMYEEINQYMSDKLSPFLCGFRKGYSTQDCLLVMLEKWKKALDKKTSCGGTINRSF